MSRISSENSYLLRPCTLLLSRPYTICTSHVTSCRYISCSLMLRLFSRARLRETDTMSLESLRASVYLDDQKSSSCKDFEKGEILELSTMLDKTEFERDIYMNECRETKVKIDELESKIKEMDEQLSETLKFREEYYSVTRLLKSTQEELLGNEAKIMEAKDEGLEALKQAELMETALNMEKQKTEELRGHVSVINETILCMQLAALEAEKEHTAVLAEKQAEIVSAAKLVKEATREREGPMPALEKELVKKTLLVDSLQLELQKANELYKSAQKATSEAVNDINQLIADMELLVTENSDKGVRIKFLEAGMDQIRLDYERVKKDVEIANEDRERLNRVVEAAKRDVEHLYGDFEIANKDRERLTRDVEVANKDIERLEKVVETARKNVDRLHRDVEIANEDRECLKRDVETANKERERLIKDVEIANEEREHLNKVVENAKKDVERLHRDVEIANNDRERLNKDIERLNKDVEVANKEIKRLHKDVEIANNNRERPDQDAETVNKYIEHVYKDVGIANKDDEIANEDVERLTKDVETLTCKFESIKNELNVVSGKETEAQAEIALLKSELDKGISKSAASEAAEEKAKLENLTIRLNIQRLESEAEEAHEEIKRLREEADKRADSSMTENNIIISVEEYQALVEKANKEEKAGETMTDNRYELESLKKELEITTARIAEFRTRAEQAAFRAEAAEKSKAALEENIRRLREQKERRKIAHQAFKEASITPTYNYKQDLGRPPKTHPPLGKILNMKF